MVMVIMVVMVHGNMVNLPVTGVRLQSWSIPVIMVIVRSVLTEKHDGAKIVDLRSIGIEIFSINTLKMHF